ncbi:ABC transporter permease [Streptomyces sp. NPDC048242]|uniref:ABC transporter permease n=1 Tax=Streptomyces sp. NPDC048242 TaxID=3155026 RepID=UPI0034131D26
MTGFIMSRARAHSLLLSAALLTVALTTVVLATLTAYSGALGDAALRHVLNDPRNAADTSLVVQAYTPAGGEADADAAVLAGARRTFDGLPVTVRSLRRSGPYGLSAALGTAAAEHSDSPDLTYFAALDRSQVRLVTGRFPGAAAGDAEVALPQAAARPLGLAPGARLTLTDRLGGKPVRVRVTGLYRPVSASAPYWRLDDLLGRGVKKSDVTMYGPLLADPALLTGGQVSAGQASWLASADFASVSTGRIDPLRRAARTGGAALRSALGPQASTTASTALPGVLDRVQRSLLVSRSTLLIIGLQLILLAGYALLLVARLLGAERAAETRLLRARGASRRRIAALAGAEALLLALPAALCAPLLAGPLTTLLAGHGPLARLGLRLDVPAGGGAAVWLAAVGGALGCALAVTLPALTDTDRRTRGNATKGRSTGRLRAGLGLRGPGARGGLKARGGRRSAKPSSDGTTPAASVPRRPRRDLFPTPLRAGADLGLLVVAGVAYWQLGRQTTGVVAADGTTAAGSTGTLGIDPLLVAAPALALLAGTVLTLRLLPPVARLAERGAAAGRSLPAALAGWQFSRRTARGAGPVLLLVLAVALGMLAIGQASSWSRSQDDQADFQAGADVRVSAAGEGELGRSDQYAALPGVRRAAPVYRTEEALSGDRTTTVLALDTTQAAHILLMRPDLASVPVRQVPAGLAPKSPAAGTPVPAGTRELRLSVSLRGAGPGTAPDVTVTLEDRYGVPYQVSFGRLPGDGRSHTLTASLPSSLSRAALTGLQLDVLQPGHAERHVVAFHGLTAVGASGTAQPLRLPDHWTTSARVRGTVVAGPRTAPTRPRATASTPPAFAYGTGYLPDTGSLAAAIVTVRFAVPQPPLTEVAAVATDRYLTSTGAHPGQRVDLLVAGENLPVRIVRSVHALPATADPERSGAHDGGAVLLDLRAVNRVMQARYGQGVPPTEWWLGAAPGRAASVTAALRALPDVDPDQVVARDEIAAELRDNPFGAGPTAAFAAAAAVAAALAAVGFAVSAAGSLRAREAEFAVLRALGATRRRLARSIAAEQAVLVGLALTVGVALGAVLAKGVLPLIVLTGAATQPVPDLLVRLPAGRVALLLAAVAVAPLTVTAVLAARRADPSRALREQGGE